MTEDEATRVMESWNLSDDTHDLNGIVEDLMDGMPVSSKSEIIARNAYDR